MKTDRDILNEIIDDQLKAYEVYSKVCTVISVNETERTCEVSPIDGSANITKVRLQSSLNGSGGFLQIPTVGSKVICTFLNSEKAFISLYSDVDETLIDTDSFKFNGGNNGGLINIEDIVSKLNTLSSEVNALITAYNAHIHITTATVGATAVPGVISPTTSQGTSVSLFNKNDFEDTNVNH